MNEIGPSASTAAGAQPSIYTDRRALSEAWYRALYDGASKAGGASAARGSAANALRGAAATPHAERRAPATASGSQSASIEPKRERLMRFTIASPGRSLAARAAAATAPARPICRNGAFRRTLCRTTLADGGAVDFLIQQRGDVLRLVAIYDGRSAPRVAAALNRARAALAQRGLRTHIGAIHIDAIQIDAIQKGSS